MVSESTDCTRIGRYAGGEREGIAEPPIIQFLVNPHSITSNLIFDFYKGNYCALIPESAILLPPRITNFTGDTINVLDVGCSYGANLFLLRDLIQRSTPKPVFVKGYDNDKSRFKKAKSGKAVYYSLESLLHPVVREIADQYFVEEKRNTPILDKESYYQFSLRKDKIAPLNEMLFFGDAEDLPEADTTSDVTICLYVLRHHHKRDQLKIFRELLRVTKPGGYIFTEEHVFQKTDKGACDLFPREQLVTSFYDTKKALYYFSGWQGREYIWPVSNLNELDSVIASLPPLKRKHYIP